MKEKVRIGLYGYGKVAQIHAQAIKSSSRAELVSVCGRTRERRDAFAAQWGVFSRDTPDEMVTKDRVDVIIVSTPHPRHHDCVVKSLIAGAHVLVEKPMALTELECDDMIAAAANAEKLLSVVCQRRWFPACQRIRAAIDEGKIGKPILAQLTILGWRDKAYYDSDPWRGKWDTEGGGILINQAPHQIDLMHWFMGPSEEIYGFWDNFNHPYIEVEDSAVAAVRFKNGGFGSVLVSNSQKPGIYAKVHIHGDAAYSVGVQTDGGAMFIAEMAGITEPPFNDIWTIPEEKNLLETYRAGDAALFQTIDPTVYFFTKQIDDFCLAVQEGRKPLSTGEDGRETVRFIERLLKIGKKRE